jgi:hypothetical protein
MAQTYPIGRIVGGGTPTVEFLGDVSDVVKPAYWFDGINVLPFYSETPIAPGPSYTLIPGTTFTVQDCAVTQLNGNYSVLPPVNNLSGPSVDFNGTRTLVRVTETVPVSIGSAVGFVVEAEATNLSHYRLQVYGSSPLVIEPTMVEQLGGLDLHGRFTRGWGEDYAANLVKVLQHQAGPVAPVAPLIGQLWFDTTLAQLSAWSGSSWVIVGGVGASTLRYDHTQAAPATTWTIPHGFGLLAPYLVQFDAYVLRSGSYKPIFPADVTFVDANTLQVTFSNPEEGFLVAKS